MKKTKKNHGKKALKIIAIILAVILVLGIMGTVANAISNNAHLKSVQSVPSVKYENQLVPEKDSDGVWTFTADNDFRVMQLTDVHIGGGWASASKDTMALNAVANMITAEKPDLVIVTGDLVFPVPYAAGTFNNMNSAELVATLMETLGVYWLPVFGNHDTEIYSRYTREEISKLYADEKWEYCLFEDNSDDGVDGYCNAVINVKNSAGIITQSFYTFDTHSYVDGDYFGIGWKYDNIHENQIDWYKGCVEKYNKYNNDLITNGDFDNKDELLEKYGTVKSLAFWHVPATEYLDAWNEYVDAGYKNTDNLTYHYGTVGESGSLVYSGVYEDEIFETMQTLGSTKGIFCGHDHLNNFSIEYKGIRLTYGFSIDYLAYSGISKLGSQRGCTMITVKPDGTFDCVAENYYQDKYATSVREEVTMQDLNAK